MSNKKIIQGWGRNLSAEVNILEPENDFVLKEIILNSESKIIWKNNPIARLKKGNDYLNPEIEIIADESLNEIVNHSSFNTKSTAFVSGRLFICLNLIHFLNSIISINILQSNLSNIRIS